MNGRPRKVSFVLQFVEHSAGPDGSTWRGALQEVESNSRHSVTHLTDIAAGLAAHGVALEGFGGETEPDGEAG